MDKILKLSDGNEAALNAAIKILENGGLVVFPTDTVYGLGVKVTDKFAIEKIYAVKGRMQTKAIAVLIGSMEQIDMVADSFPQSAQKLGKSFWPGALTMVVKRRKELPEILSPDETIGIRIPDDDFVRSLINQVGPLATTSANLSGQPSAINAAMAIKQLGDKVDLIIDGGECRGGQASTVIDCTQEVLHVLREGAISKDSIIKKIKIG